jgi:hypothetical protein
MTDNAKGLGETAQYAFISSGAVILPKLISFVLRGSLIRYAGLEILGILFVRLELLSTTILFFSREAIRRASISGRFFHNK